MQQYKSFELSKGSSYGKEFGENYSKSINNQIGNSKENTQAFADVTSVTKGENLSDANSTSKKVSNAYSELDSATKTFNATKSLGSSQSNSLLESAFQNYFEKNSGRTKNWSNEDKANFIVENLKGWQQSQDGIKDMGHFLEDNLKPAELNNPINNQSKIDNGEAKLANDTSDVTGSTYDGNKFDGKEAEIRKHGKDYENSNTGGDGVKEEVNNNVKKDGEVEKVVDKKSDENDKKINANEDKNTNAVNDSVLINGAKALDGFSENIKDGIKNLPGGTDDRVNPDLKRFADNNATQNETTYKNSKLGNNNLIQDNTFSKDDINSSQLSKASTEDLARIYTYDKNHNKLSTGAKNDLHEELGKRGYDFKSNNYSSNYEGEVPKHDSIIPNGDGGNPGSSARKLKNDFGVDTMH